MKSLIFSPDTESSIRVDPPRCRRQQPSNPAYADMYPHVAIHKHLLGRSGCSAGVGSCCAFRFHIPSPTCAAHPPTHTTTNWLSLATSEQHSLSHIGGNHAAYPWAACWSKCNERHTTQTHTFSPSHSLPHNLSHQSIRLGGSLCSTRTLATFLPWQKVDNERRQKKTK